MLALILSGAVALASLVFFFSAFFAPKLHRKDDFLWSGFGFFYGLVLWNCAQLFTGAVLLGQLAAVILILAFAWQTLKLRAAIAKNAIAEVPSFSLLDWLGGGLKRKPKAPVVVPEKVQKKVAKKEDIAKVEDQEKPEAPEDKVEQTKVVAEEVAEILVETAQEVVEEMNTAAEAVAEKIAEAAKEIVEPAPTPASEPPQTEEKQAKAVEVSLKKPKSKLFQRLFGGKNKPEPVVNVVEAVLNSPEPVTDDEDWGEDAELPVSENQEVPITPMSETVETVMEEIAEVTAKIVEEVETTQEVEEISVSVEVVVTPVSEELTAPGPEESATELVESTEEPATLECTENKVPEAYAAYVESEDPAEAIADELEPNSNDQDNAP